jgi:hypothetical protein
LKPARSPRESWADLLPGDQIVIAGDAVERSRVPARIMAPLHGDDRVDRHPFRQAVLLVDETDPAAQLRGEAAAVLAEQKGPARARREKAEQDPEQGGFAGPVGADQGMGVIVTCPGRNFVTLEDRDRRRRVRARRRDAERARAGGGPISRIMSSPA